MSDNQAVEKVPEPIIEESVRRYSAFKGRNYEEIAHLIKAGTRYISRVGYRQAKPEELNKFFEELLSAQPEIISTEIESPITAEFLASQLKPWIEDIRQRLFHSKSAPFSCISDAKKWLDAVNRRIDEWHKKADEWHKKADEWEKKVDEWTKRSNEYHDCWQAILEKYPHIKGGIEEWSLMKKQGIEAELPTADEWQKLTEIQLAMESLEIGRVGEPPEPGEGVNTYWALIDAMFEVDKVTSFTWKSLEMYILADALPVLPAFTVGIVRKTHSLPSGVELQNRFAQVIIRGNLTDKGLRALYRNIRRELGIKHLQPLKPKDLELYKMVAQRGSIPTQKGAKGVVAFWASIMNEWNTRHPRDKYKTWKGFQSRYQRIIARLDRVTRGGATK